MSIEKIECKCGKVFEFGDNEVLPEMIGCPCGERIDCKPVLQKYYPTKLKELEE